MAVELTFEQLKDLATSHWKRHLPKYYRNLKQSGELDKRVENAARFNFVGIAYIGVSRVTAFSCPVGDVISESLLRKGTAGRVLKR